MDMIAPSKQRMKAGLKAGLVHLSLCLIIAIGIAVVIFKIWFPYPYNEILGGSKLFWMILCIDVVVGPLLTMIIFNPQKPRGELKRDMACILIIQLVALCIGIHAVLQARPIFLAFEVDRFKVVTYADIKKDDLSPIANELHKIPWQGVRLIGSEIPDGSMLESLELSLQGYDLAYRPKAWVPYEKVSEQVRKIALPVHDLIKKRPYQKNAIEEELKKLGKSELELLWLPVTSYKSMDWVALIDKDSARPLSIVQVDGF
ncbi:hypothetical protein G7048_12830 [Diaphorobacter sp. HDW4B]|uniref:TfpX/TfpZ family type IV pilin accessory protein n=1 Tax=Diaphorobacter sp. HDW4B TaxID=2714925 RepID=UPI001409E134|nr:TfpX/TfpZ family type IV pilin accessory protein [Diaphorobacter sp. HDW4B]QIL71168.1 hypothetical protein G7048_12830 [Diaphorobacter sp. HDW4B]